jgi:hypothetical protein
VKDRKVLARLVLVVTVALVLTLVLAAPAFAKRGNQGNPRVLPPNSSAYGSTYGEWGAKWWQWALAIPAATNPLNDETGDLVAMDQSGPVWFLCGTINFTPVPGVDYAYEGVAERTCTIPAGKALFFPIVNVEASTAEGNGETVEELTALCDFYVTHTTELSMTIDGRELGNLFAYRGTSGGYPLWWPDDDALFGLPPLDEPTLSVSDGYWMFLPPLRPGAHELHWTGKQEFSEAADGFDAIFSQDITYHLTVVGD